MMPMELSQKPNWRQKVVAWVANLLGVQTYPAPFVIMIYDVTGELAEQYRQRRAEDEELH